ncbi:MAG: RING-HC finger protein [Candidatus Omnitrophota bacterium]
MNNCSLIKLERVEIKKMSDDDDFGVDVTYGDTIIASDTGGYRVMPGDSVTFDSAGNVAVSHAVVTSAAAAGAISSGLGTEMHLDGVTRSGLVGCTIFGDGNVLSGTGLTVVGDRNTVSGTNASLHGNFSTVTGVAASAYGNHNQVTGVNAMARGDYCKATGVNAECTGRHGSATGFNATYRDKVVKLPKRPRPGAGSESRTSVTTFAGPMHGCQINAGIIRPGLHATALGRKRTRRTAAKKLDAEEEPSPATARKVAQGSAGVADHAPVADDADIVQLTLVGDDVPAADGEASCTVCLTNKRQLAAAECGHLLCFACARALIDRKDASEVMCPTCRGPVKRKMIRVFV